jgi:hypothetical protein
VTSQTSRMEAPIAKPDSGRGFSFSPPRLAVAVPNRLRKELSGMACLDRAIGDKILSQLVHL